LLLFLPCCRVATTSPRVAVGVAASYNLKPCSNPSSSSSLSYSLECHFPFALDQRHNMDLFIYNPTYEVWICTARQCQYTVSSQTLLTHLRIHHRSHLTVATSALHEAVLTEILKRPWIDPTKRPCVIPSPGDPPIPGLPVYRGYGCPHCSYIAHTTETMQKHRCETHKDLEPPCGRGRQSQWQLKASYRLAARAVSCQCFFPSKHSS
jgi:hypothetical protein